MTNENIAAEITKINADYLRNAAPISNEERIAILAILGTVECYTQSQLETYQLAESAIARCCGIDPRDLRSK